MTYCRGLRFPVCLETLQHLLLFLVCFLHLFELLCIHLLEGICTQTITTLNINVLASQTTQYVSLPCIGRLGSEKL